MKQQHQPWYISLFKFFADSDNDPEDIERKEGTYVDSQNCRNTGITGHSGSIEKIHGEVVKYPNIDNRCTGGTGTPFPLTYQCIGSIQVLNHIVEFWADELAVGFPYVRVDGWVVLMPTLAVDFPISTVFPPQLHKNDSCVGGEVFYTDDNIPPFRFNVSDLLKNSGINPANNLRDNTYPCTNKYFSGFNISQYQIQPPSQQDHPVFIEVFPVGNQPHLIGTGITQNVQGGGGLVGGMYQYAIAYTDSTGNVTNWSELTPQIPLPAGIGYNQPVYPSTKVYGGAPGNIVTTNGIHIRFRVTNINNFAYISVRRLTWAVGAAVGTPANNDSVIWTSANGYLTDGKIDIIDFYDEDNSTLSPVTQQAATQNNLTAIQAAKGIRYYQSKLTLWNITYASRNLAGSSLQFNANNGTMYPFVRPLGVQGYKDIWNDVYRKSYMRGERYGEFALVGFDNDGNASFALPIPSQWQTNTNTGWQTGFNTNTKNYTMPQRRDALIGASLQASVEVYNSLSSPIPRTYASTSNTTAGTTYEVFDQYDMVQRDPSRATASIPIGNYITFANAGNSQKKVNGEPCDGYLPFRPTWDGDAAYNFAYLIDIGVNDGSVSNPFIGIGSSYNSAIQGELQSPGDPLTHKYSGFLPYNPKGFMPNLYALGMILQGVGGLPGWCSAFAIVRTAPAMRVLAQGQSYYNMNSSLSSPPAWQTPTSGKNGASVIWDSPDFFSEYVNTTNISNNSTSGRYKAQLVSYVGMFSEVYNGYSPFSAVVTSGTIAGYIPGEQPWASQIDMISYCRILHETRNSSSGTYFNPVASGSTMVGTHAQNLGDDYVTLRSWRNDISHSPFTNTAYSHELNITALSQQFPSGDLATAGGSPRRKAWYLGTDTIYSQAYASTGFEYRDSTVADWHEPLHVINIVDDSQNVGNGVSNEYYQTGCFIKTVSIIGSFVAGTLFYPLVDERWQDCIPAENAGDLTANQNRFIYIQDSSNTQSAWLNVTYMSAAQVSAIKAAIASNGYYNATNCLNATVPVYGIYTHTITPYTNGNLVSTGNKLYQIYFNQGMTPIAGNLIIVKYDYCAPIEVFGGDAFIGEYNYPIADCSFSGSNAQPNHSADNFIIDHTPLPYRTFVINENTNIMHNNNTTKIGIPTHTCSIQGYNMIEFNRYLVETRLASSYVRQLICNGIVESRTNLDLFFGEVTSGASSMVSSASFFPNINYIIRPIYWDSGNLSYIQNQYKTDYPNEDWGYGGFRINPLPNYDYDEYPSANKSYSMPSSGFTEQLNYCTRIIWSDTRSTNEQNTPNLLNFPSVNIYDADDFSGGFNKAWDSSVAGKQGNLYGFTNTGTVMMLTNKRILTEETGQQLAEMGGADVNFVENEVWLSRDKGMPDQMWRSAAEYSNKIFWCDKSDFYRLEDNKIEDIGENTKYFSTLLPILGSILPGYGSDVTAVWYELYQEYWLCVNPHRTIVGLQSPQFISLVSTGSATPPTSYLVHQDSIIDIQGTTVGGIYVNNINPAYVTEIYLVNNTATSISLYYVPNNYVYQVNVVSGQTMRAFWNPTTSQWNFDTNPLNFCNDPVWAEQDKGFSGQYKYRFDKYTTDLNGNIYGSRLGATWLLNSGYIQNGNNVASWVLQTINPKEGFNLSKEFIRYRQNSNYVPDQILFFPTIEAYTAGTPHSVLTGFPALKNYGGATAPSWEGYINRGMNAPYLRAQGRFFLYQTFYAQPTEYWINSISAQYKILK